MVVITGYYANLTRSVKLIPCHKSPTLDNVYKSNTVCIYVNIYLLHG